MRVRVRLFAVLRELATDRCELELADAATVDDAWRELVARYPALAAHRAWVRPARGGAYATWAQPLRDDDDLAFLPPVSGGSTTVGLSGDPIDVDALERAVASPGHGALVTFVGRARDRADDGREVVQLEYEAYVEMAEPVLHDIAREADARWGARIAVVHRVGTVRIGDAAVAIVTAAAHRSDAYEANRYVIEAIKQRLPIWKRERFVDGAEWKRAGA